jgi:hypothetical protein
MRTAILVVAVSLLGCVRAEHPGVTRVGGGGRIPQAGGAATRAALSQKVVSGKEEPTTLIALDGSTCSVSAQRFRETAIGEKVWCAW